MSLKSTTHTLFNQDGYEITVKDGVALSESNAALLLAGSDGSDTHYIALDSSGRSLVAGAGTAGSPNGGILSTQGASGTGDELKVVGHVDIDSVLSDVSIVQDNASELLASVGGLGAAGSAIVGSPVRLSAKNEADGTTVDLLSDSAGRLVIDGAVPSGDPLAGAPIRIGASDGSNAVDILSDSDGRLIMVGAAADGAAVSGAPVRIGGSDSTNTQDIRTDLDGRLIFVGAEVDGSAVAGAPVRLGASDGSITRNILSDDQGRLIRVGADAAGTAPTANPVLAGGWDVDNVQIFKLDSAGALQVSQVKSSEATIYTTAATTSSSSLLSANTAREGAMVFNDSNKFLYVKLGGAVSYSDFTTRIAPGGQYLVPFGYTGSIFGAWSDASAQGTARVTEFAPGAGGGGGGGGSLPLMTNISAWYDAEDIMQADGSNIDTWADKSGNGNDLSVYSVYGTKPTLDAVGSYFNGKKSVKFDKTPGDPYYPDGFSLYSYRSSITGNVPQGSDPISLYTVFKPDLALSFAMQPVISIGETYNRLIMWGGADTNGVNGWAAGSPQNSSGTANWVSDTNFTGGGSDLYQATTAAKINSFIIGAGEQLQNSEFLVNGSSAGVITNSTSTTTINLPSGNTDIVLGGLSGERGYMGYDSRIAHGYEGRIAEVIVYKTQHTASERNQVLAYLSAKYGIAV